MSNFLLAVFGLLLVNIAGRSALDLNNAGVTDSVNEDIARNVLSENEDINKENPKLESNPSDMTSCEDWAEYESGIRTINLSNGNSLNIYCDQGTLGSGWGWTVFQRRLNGAVDFYRGWSDYRRGFGNLTQEFWLGLENLYQITKDGKRYELLITMEANNGSKRYALYDDFSISSECEGYALHFSGYSGDAGDSLTHHKNMKFTTKDHDQDRNLWNNCAIKYYGAWWFDNCMLWSDLNGHYNDIHYRGVHWYTMNGWGHTLKKAEMMFRVKQ